MYTNVVVVIAGSKTDTSHCQKIASALKTFEVDVIIRFASAHKTAKHLLNILEEYESDSRSKVYITVAGRSNALSGFVDGVVSAPVIACPPIHGTLEVDIFSSLRMPSGIAPAVVLEPENAALLAIKILGLNNSELHEKIKSFQHNQRHTILDADKNYDA